MKKARSFKGGVRGNFPILIIAAIILAMGFCFVNLSSVSAATTGIPSYLTYQGRLKDSSGTALSGSYDFSFNLYDAATDGNLLWTENETLTATSGYFSTTLGDGTAFSTSVDFTKNLWLQISVGPNGGALEAMSSRVAINSVAFALAARGIENAASAPATVYAGRMYFNTTNGKLYVYDSVNTQWVNLGLIVGTDVQAYDADLTTYAGITPSADIQTLLGSANAAAARSNLGLAIGSNVQAYDADLTTYAGITPSADIQTLLGSANAAAARSNLGAAASGANSDITALSGLTGAISAPTSITMATGGGLRTGTTSGNTVLLQAYDTDTGPGYTTFGTLTAGTTPTFDLASSTTIGSNYIYRVGGTDVAVADGGTGVSSWTQWGVLYADTTGSLAQVTDTASNAKVLMNNGAGAPRFTGNPYLEGTTLTTATSDDLGMGFVQILQDTSAHEGTQIYQGFRVRVYPNNTTGWDSTYLLALQNSTTDKFTVDLSGNVVAVGSVTAASFSGNASTATTATNIAGGGAGQIPYQSGAGATTFLAAGTDKYILYSNNGTPAWTNSPTLTGGLAMAPGATGTLVDYQLETEWTTGTLLNADFGGATVQSGDMTGVALDFNTNLAGVTDLDVTGYQMKTPALTQSTANTTNYIGHNLPTAGALVQDTLAGTINWRGINLQMPNTTQTTGTVSAYGLNVVGGTVTSGTAAGINIDMNADADTAIRVAQGTSSFLGPVDISLPTGITTALSIPLDNLTSGTLISSQPGTPVTLANLLTGVSLNWATNITATNQSIDGYNITFPSVTNTGGGNYAYRGLSITEGSLTQNTDAGTTTFAGVDVAVPAITQTTGTVNAYGVKVSGGTITTGGTSYGVYVAGPNASAGTAYGVNIGMNADADFALYTSKGNVTNVFGAASRYFIDAATTPHTGTTGVLALDLDTATASVSGVNVNTSITADVADVTGIYSAVNGLSAGGGTGNITNAFQADLYGDSDDTNHFYTAFAAKNTTSNVAGNTMTGFDVGTGYDEAFMSQSGIVAFVFGAGQGMSLDAATTNSTLTTGILDIDQDSTVSGIAIDVDAEVIDDDGIDTQAGVMITMTNSANDSDVVYGLQVAELGGAASGGNEYAIYQAGTAWDYGLYVTDDSYFSGQNTFAGRMVQAPLSTGTLTDYQLETEWTTGTLVNADFGGATVQSGDMSGVTLDFNTNLAGVTDLDVTGYQMKTPALTQSTANTTNYIGYNLPTAGALVQNTLAGTIDWRGINLQMPNTTQTTGIVNAYGVKVTGGAVTSGTAYGLNISMNADTDSAIYTGKGNVTNVFGAASRYFLDAATTPHTDTTGVLNMDLDTATASVLGINVISTLTADVANVTGIESTLTGLSTGGGTGNITKAFRANIAGDSDDTSHLYTAFEAANTVDNVAGNTMTGFDVGTGYDEAFMSQSGIVAFVFGAGQGMSLDAATTDNTGTAGVLDIDHDSTASGVAIDVNSEVVDDNAVDTQAGVKITMTNSADDSDVVYGLQVADLGGAASDGNEYAIYQTGTAWDYGLYVSDTAYFGDNVGIGTPSAASEKLEIYRGNLKFDVESAPTIPTAALVETAGNCTAGDHSVKVTFVTALGETEGSPSSAMVTCDETHGQILVTNIPTGTAGVVTGRNVYMSKNGSPNQFLVVPSPVINDNSTTEYTINVADGSLQTTLLPTMNTTAAGLNTGGVGLYSLTPALTQTANVTQTNYYGFRAGGGALEQNTGQGSIFWTGDYIRVPNITQTTGMIQATGVGIGWGEITTGGTMNGLLVGFNPSGSMAGVGVGTLNGININTITGGSGTETALFIGSGWDTAISSTGNIAFTLGFNDGIVVNAADQNNTNTAGAVDINHDSTATTAALDIDSEVIDDNAVDTQSGILITMTNSADDSDVVYGLQVANLGGSASAGAEYGIYQAGTSWDYGLYLEDDAFISGTARLGINTWTADGDVAVYYDTGAATKYLGIQGSDIRLKKNVVPLGNALDILTHVNAYLYNTMDEIDGAKKRLGVMAQELLPYVPELTFEITNPGSTETYYGVHYDKLTVLLLEAIKEQQTQIQSLSLGNNLQGNLTGNIATQELKVSKHVTFNQDTVGQARILAGATEVKVNFVEEYAYQPVVVLTLRGENILISDFKYTLVDETTSGFTIKISALQTAPIEFNWQAFGVDGGKISVSDGTTEDIKIMVADNALLTESFSAPVDNSTTEATATTVESESVVTTTTEENAPAATETTATTIEERESVPTEMTATTAENEPVVTEESTTTTEESASAATETTVTTEASAPVTEEPVGADSVVEEAPASSETTAPETPSAETVSSVDAVE